MKKNSFQKLLEKYRYVWALLYTGVYLLWFSSLEKNITTNYHIMHCALDDVIPFNEYFIFPYLFWFIYIFFTLIYLVTVDAGEFCRYGFYLVVGMSICLLICQIFPNGTAPGFRPDVDPNKNWASSIIASIYKTDTPTNVFPSIHVYNAIGTHYAISRSKHFEKKPLVRQLSLLAAILICISTMFVKQHSVIDVVGGLVLSWVMAELVYGKIPVPRLFPASKKEKKIWV